jgi:hypothetical protein
MSLEKRMKRTLPGTLVLGVLLCTAPHARAATYYVDAEHGSDANSGTSAAQAWKSLDAVDHGHFQPGDSILFCSGSRWSGSLALRSSGAPGAPIRVDRYGDGALPRIDGGGAVENVLELVNVHDVEVRHLEITNQGSAPGVRRGVLIAAADFGTARHIVVGDLYIHDVNGTNQRKDTGGILFRTTGARTPSRFDGLTIERNILWKVDRSAIAGESSEFARSRWFPSLHVVIRDNYADDIGGDGIVPWATDGALIEGNVVVRGNQRANTYNAGIWPWSTDNSLFVLNEAAWVHGTMDGEGFDSDFNSRNTRFAYNYSHDNDGGFMLICTPGRRDPSENIGNTGTVIEYNISRNDHTRTFNLSGADETTVAHNAIYTAPDDDVQILLVSNWEGWSRGAVFRDNTFDVAGTGRYGHEVQRDPDGTYRIEAGWGGASDIRFEANRYFGHIVDMPADPGASEEPRFRKPALDWDEPIFDPAHPEAFPAYLRKHRAWMLQLFTSQFQQPPQLPESASGEEQGN